MASVHGHSAGAEVQVRGAVEREVAVPVDGRVLRQRERCAGNVIQGGTARDGERAGCLPEGFGGTDVQRAGGQREAAGQGAVGGQRQRAAAQLGQRKGRAADGVAQRQCRAGVHVDRRISAESQRAAEGGQACAALAQRAVRGRAGAADRQSFRREIHVGRDVKLRPVGNGGAAGRAAKRIGVRCKDHTGGHSGGAGIAVACVQGQRARAELREGTRAGHRSVQDNRIGAVEIQRAVIGHAAAGECAGGTAVADLQRAATDECAGGHIDIIFKRQRAGALLGQRSRRNRAAGEIVSEGVAHRERPATCRRGKIDSAGGGRSVVKTRRVAVVEQAVRRNPIERGKIPRIAIVADPKNTDGRVIGQQFDCLGGGIVGDGESRGDGEIRGDVTRRAGIGAVTDERVFAGAGGNRVEIGYVQCR